MKLRLPTRIPALWLVLLFLLPQGADALGTHACPQHDGVAGAASGAHAGHHAGGAHGQRDGSGTHDGPCTCVGECCAGAGGASTPHAALSWRPPFVTRSAASREAKLPVRSLRTPFLLPYAQAPPLVG